MKFFFFFFAIVNCLYARSAANVTSHCQSFFCKAYLTSVIVSSADTITLSSHTSIITTNAGITFFKDQSWYFVPVIGKYSLCVDSKNNIFIAGESFVGKVLLVSQKGSSVIDTIISVNHTVYWEKPKKIFCIGENVYYTTHTSLYKLNKEKSVLIDSTRNGIVVLPGRTGLVTIKNNNVTLIIDDRKYLLPDYPLLLEGEQDLKFFDVVKESPKKTPFFFRWWAWVFYILVLLGLIVLTFIKRKDDFEAEKAKLEQIIKERTAELILEKEKTDELLANLLPKDTADELKNTGKATSQKFDMVTVLFSDIQGFTKIAEQMNPEKLIDELDNFFFHFDSVVEKYNIEKIKTIGDAYMCAGGIPYKNRTNPVEVVLAAIEIQEYMRQLKSKNDHIWDLRIGIHTGAVIAGVVGHKRMSYDIWGDTVNTASRMESSGQPGKVNISGQTYELIKEFYICEYRGRMPVKYKGDVDMYFVKGIRPELSVDLKVVPNKRFFVQLQLLRILDLEEFIIDKLTKELPSNMYFHNSRHTREVYTLAELIGRAEDISQEEMLLLRTAALFVDVGYLYSYDTPENEGSKFARDVLIKFKYSKDQIDAVCSLILSTRFIENIKTKTEAIFIDACLNHLGRVDYLDHSKDHFREVKERVESLSEKEWFYLELKRVERFKFYTVTAKLLREVSAEDQVQKIRNYANLY